MQVLVLNSVPAGLRGDVTRWFMEIATGVYVGNVSARIRDELWERILSLAGRGRAIMVYPARNEQGYVVRTYQYDWEPEEFDGLTLMMRPYPVAQKDSSGSATANSAGDLSEVSNETNDPSAAIVDHNGSGIAQSNPSVPTDIPPRAWSTAARRRYMKKKH